ncbi:thiamine pyrophosphokinase [Paucilactobacillus hokkaidonensis JCM 18461]|uniref:Thiamine diphosphokinase n=2 Tax=Paucilactobacillus hokkaidonensis TaxID=1193095 RepID=A0A0A1GYK8_9LACO|nr:thiamine diphosphokinase [Paucilactobacillus hokkaidonensis]KRO09758.1 thiamine pyrophosphokinase [Paucilactobacillus hokkaidonensis]BAP85576.1 thiamine pyrophosphokinase [Paucilactobacillus hokkaidonensis JCM 18461]
MKKIEKINILVGGPTDQWPDQLKQGKMTGDWIGIDRGAKRLLKLGIIPVVAAGDFDSIDAEELTNLQSRVSDIRQYPPEKDLTDTQIGVSIALDDFDASKIDVYGATGGRLDHLLANLFLVLDEKFRPNASKIRLIDQQNTVNFYLPGEYEIVKEPDKKYLAFVNLTSVKGLSLTDEKYQLDSFDSEYPISWASNEFVGTKNHFSFRTGVVAVVQSRD